MTTAGTLTCPQCGAAAAPDARACAFCRARLATVACPRCFGMGIERVVTWICGIDHLRETIAFPRMLYRIYP